MKRTFFIIFIAGICLSIGIYLWQSRVLRAGEMPEVTPIQMQQMLETNEILYVYFYSPTCVVCIKSEPMLIQAVKELGIKNIVKIDLQKYEYLRQDLQIKGTPSIFVYRNQKIIKGITGDLKSVEEYKNFFREIGETS